QAESQAAIRAREFVDEVRSAAESAAEAAGGWHERQLELDATRLRVRFAGGSLLAAFMPALESLIAPERAPARDDIAIAVWDSASSGIAFPPLPWRISDVDGRGRVRSLPVEGLSIFHVPYYDGITIFDERARDGVYWARTAETIPWWERGSPLRTALNLA